MTKFSGHPPNLNPFYLFFFADWRALNSKNPYTYAHVIVIVFVTIT